MRFIASVPCGARKRRRVAARIRYSTRRAAIGYAGVTDLNVEKLELYLDDVLVAKNGGRNPEYREADGQRVMKQDEITVRVALHRGVASATLWTCDLSHDYVSINADYRS